MEIRAVPYSPPSLQCPGVGYLWKLFPPPITGMDLSSEGTNLDFQFLVSQNEELDQGHRKAQSP